MRSFAAIILSLLVVPSLRAEDAARPIQLPTDPKAAEALFHATARAENDVNSGQLACAFYKRGQGKDNYYAAALNGVAAIRGDLSAAAYEIKFFRQGVGAPQSDAEALHRLTGLLEKSFSKMRERDPSGARKIRDDLVAILLDTSCGPYDELSAQFVDIYYQGWINSLRTFEDTRSAPLPNKK
jgi:hypothetical protein